MVDNEIVWRQDLQLENTILKGFLCAVLYQSQDPKARELALETVYKLQAVSAQDLDAVLAEQL